MKTSSARHPRNPDSAAYATSRMGGNSSGVNMEGSATNSFLRAQTYSLICIDCHGLDALFRFKYYHNPKDRVETLQNLIIPDLR